MCSRFITKSKEIISSVADEKRRKTLRVTGKLKSKIKKIEAA